MSKTTKPHNTAYTADKSPRAVPLLGHAPALLRDPVGFLTSLDPNCDLIELRLGPHRGYLVYHPELVHRVFTDDRTFDKGGPIWDSARKVLGQGLATCPHDIHRKRRRIVQPAFHRSQMAGYATVMAEQIAATMATWQDGHTIDITAAMFDVIGQITTRNLFAAEAAAGSVHELRPLLHYVTYGIYRRAVLPLGVLDRLPTPANRKYTTSIARIHALIDRIIQEYRSSTKDYGDLLSMLLTAGDPETGERLDDRKIREEILNLYTPATDTSSAALAWAFYFVTRERETQTQLTAEVDAVLGGRIAEWSDLASLELTGRVVKEALRLRPPVWILSRTTACETKLAGKQFKAGTAIFVSPLPLHYDTLLFPNPARFDPNRWLPAQVTRLPKGTPAYFGGGARKCIGDSYATAEVTLLLASVLARWRLLPLSDGDVKARPGVVLSPDKLLMRLQQR